MAEVELTSREQDILKLLCEGFSDRAIAEQLVLSVGTVKWYNKQIFAKLGVNNRVQATLATNKLELLATIADYSLKQHLPLPLTSFIGRSETITEVCTLLRDHRLVTIVGQGGIGKTRLALEIAKRLQNNDLFAPWFVALAAYSQPEEVPLAIANSLGITIQVQKTALQQIIEILSHQPTLLVLDNFEHLLPAADALMAILNSVREVRLLVTSREHLNLYGETVFRLEGLTVSPGDGIDEATHSDAVRLFVDRARHAVPTFEPSDDELKQIIDICRLLQGLPLAIEHAASWVHLLGANTILTEMERSLDILYVNRRGLESRHQSMRAVIDHSWNRLALHEQHTLMQLSVFRGGFQRDAAAEVADANLDMLAGLVAKSFVSRSGVDRYDLHELHRQYALERLTESGKTAVARKQHARFFEQLVRRIAPQRWNMDTSQRQALDRLDEEYANLREAIQWSLLEDDGCFALNILGYGAIFFHDRGHGTETVGWTRAVLKCCSNTDAALRTRAYFALALQDPLTTDDEHRAYLDFANHSENLELIAIAYWQCGDHAAFIHAHDDARRHYEHALELAAQTDYQNLYSIILSYMGQLAETLGDLELATQHYRDAYEHMRAHGVRSATRPRNLGRMMLLKSDEIQARELFRIAIDNAIYLSSPLWTYETLLVIAAYLQEKGDLSSAIQLFAACHTLALCLKRPPLEVQETADASRGQLEAEVFNKLWTTGKSLSTADALGLAQQSLEEMDTA
jgi:predicted ATPase/DNA-binding CsgD family transcriptional regulator